MGYSTDMDVLPVPYVAQSELIQIITRIINALIVIMSGEYTVMEALFLAVGQIAQNVEPLLMKHE